MTLISECRRSGLWRFGWVGLGLLGVAALARPASAVVVDHWRFEESPGFLSDSVGARPLTATGTVSQSALPGSGSGSKFDNPIPQTGQANAFAANFGNRTGHLNAAHDASTNGSFTIEAYVNLANASQTVSATFIASKWIATDNQRSWGFGVAGSDGAQSIGSGPLLSRQLFFGLSTNGTNTAGTTAFNFPAPGLTLALNTDYYVAVAYTRPSAQDVNDGNLTFYLKDLTTPGASMQSVDVAMSRQTFATSSGSMQIGTLNTDAAIRWVGLLDEVRLSDSVLPQSQLLAVPEPGAFGILLLSTSACLIARRRRA